MPGRLITFEGPEGAGKSTIIPKLADWLRELGHTVLTTREPGATEVGKQIRQILLHGTELSGLTELFLFLADRSHHVTQVIRPAMERGEIVLCDRFADSTVVYQSVARGIDIDQIRRLNITATGGLVPDLTLLLDLPATVGLGRITGGDRLDREPLEFHERVAAGYRELSVAEPRRFRIVDAARPIDEVFEAARSHLFTFLGDSA